MKKINRYDFINYGDEAGMEQLEDGDYVEFEDYDALQQQVNKLAAELVNIREQAENVYSAGYNHGHINTVDGIAYAATVEDEFYHNALQVMAEVETLHTDAFLLTVQADGVEKFANLTIDSGKDEFNRFIDYAGRQALLYAAQLRAKAEELQKGGE